MFKNAQGEQFKQIWFLQTIEALANVVVGPRAAWSRAARRVPMNCFAIGARRGYGQYYLGVDDVRPRVPVATLAVGQMVPVMIGSLLIGGAKYSVASTSVGPVAARRWSRSPRRRGRRQRRSASRASRVARLRRRDGRRAEEAQGDIKEKGLKDQPYDMMAFTNPSDVRRARRRRRPRRARAGPRVPAGEPGDPQQDPRVRGARARPVLIFYTIANFDPLVCTTVTATRKIFTVLLSIFTKGHAMNQQGWAGISSRASASSPRCSQAAAKGKTAAKKKNGWQRCRRVARARGGRARTRVRPGHIKEYGRLNAGAQSLLGRAATIGTAGYTRDARRRRAEVRRRRVRRARRVTLLWCRCAVPGNLTHATPDLLPRAPPPPRWCGATGAIGLADRAPSVGAPFGPELKLRAPRSVQTGAGAIAEADRRVTSRTRPKSGGRAVRFEL